MRPTRAACYPLILALAAVPIRAAGGAAGPGALRAILPDAPELSGWRALEAPRVFQGEDLYEMIDGGADLYLEYGFVQSLSARYASPPATLQVELYQMADEAAAYGVFSLSQTGKGVPVDIGQAARLFDYYLAMWKGDCFVSITVTESAGDAQPVLRRFAAAIAKRIPGSGQVPALVERLPARDLSGPRYFRGPLGAASLYAFAGNDPFKAREGVGGSYPGQRLIMFRYQSAGQAAVRLTEAGQALAQTGDYRDLASGPDGFDCLDADSNRIAARVEGDCIVVRISPAQPTSNK